MPCIADFGATARFSKSYYLRLVFSSLDMTNHMWLFKITYVKFGEKIQHSSCTGRMSSTQQPCGASSYCIGRRRYRTSLLVQIRSIGQSSLEAVVPSREVVRVAKLSITES